MLYGQCQSCSCAQLVNVYAMKTYAGVDVWIHIFLTLAPAALTPESGPRYEFDRLLGGRYTWWRGVKFCPYGDSNSDPSAVQPVAIRYTGPTLLYDILVIPNYTIINV